jgi:hypothetical protein
MDTVASASGNEKYNLVWKYAKKKSFSNKLIVVKGKAVPVTGHEGAYT